MNVSSTHLTRSQLCSNRNPVERALSSLTPLMSDNLAHAMLGQERTKFGNASATAAKLHHPIISIKI